MVGVVAAGSRVVGERDGVDHLDRDRPDPDVDRGPAQQLAHLAMELGDRHRPQPHGVRCARALAQRQDVLPKIELELDEAGAIRDRRGGQAMRADIQRDVPPVGHRRREGHPDLADHLAPAVQRPDGRLPRLIRQRFPRPDALSYALHRCHRSPIPGVDGFRLFALDFESDHVPRRCRFGRRLRNETHLDTVLCPRLPSPDRRTKGGFPSRGSLPGGHRKGEFAERSRRRSECSRRLVHQPFRARDRKATASEIAAGTSSPPCRTAAPRAWTTISDIDVPTRIHSPLTAMPRPCARRAA